MLPFISTIIYYTYTYVCTYNEGKRAVYTTTYNYVVDTDVLQPLYAADWVQPATTNYAPELLNL